MLTNNDSQIFRKLQAIDAAESYLIARTRREIRASQAASHAEHGHSGVVLAASAACLTAAFVLLQVWPYIVTSTSV